jgi:elongation of very long chain fatty acids protein 6
MGPTALFYAATNGKLSTVKILLKNGATSNLKDEHGETALTSACKNGHEKVATVLLEHLSSSAVKSKTEVTFASQTLVWAVKNSMEKVALALIEKGADIFIRDESSESLDLLLIVAVNAKNNKVISALMDKGADPNRRNNEKKKLSWGQWFQKIINHATFGLFDVGIEIYYSLIGATYYKTSDSDPELSEELSLFTTIDISRINESHLFNMFLNPIFPITAVLLYLLSEPVFNIVRNTLDVKRDSFIFKSLIFIHYVLLAGFSLWVAVATWPILVTNILKTNGFQHLHCSKQIWNDSKSGIATWAVIFYVSKFYEFIDMWILVLNKQSPSFLQKFHHFGIALTMYCGVITESNWLIWILVLNSSIHTMMYTNFALAKLGYRSPLASILTNLQMLQFITWIVMASCIFFYQDCESATPASKASLVAIQLYAVCFIYLIKKKYAKKKNNQIKDRFKSRTKS